MNIEKLILGNIKKMHFKKMQDVYLKDDYYHFNCPNCFDKIIVQKKQLRCKIFRHAVYKTSYKQVNPHLSREKCEKLTKENKVYGCCKPFEIISNGSKMHASVCEYK